MKVKVWESDSGSVIAYWEYDAHSEDHGLLAIRAINPYDRETIPVDWLCGREMEELMSVLSELLEVEEQ